MMSGRWSAASGAFLTASVMQWNCRETLLDGGLERKCKKSRPILRYYPGIFLKRLRKTCCNISQNVKFFGPIFNSVYTCGLRCSVADWFALGLFRDIFPSLEVVHTVK